MGKVEEILEIIDPLTESLSLRCRVICQAPRDTIDILFSKTHGGGWLTFLFHQETDDTFNVYFLLPSYNTSYVFIKDREELMKNERIIVLSGRNVFQWLKIPGPAHTNGILENLTELCKLIQENSSILVDMFSMKNIEKTYKTIIVMDGNNETEIQNCVKPYFTDGFATQRKREQDLEKYRKKV